MKKVRLTKSFTCDELNQLDLPVKVAAILRRGEDIEIIFESDDDNKVDKATKTILAHLQSFKVKHKKTVKNVMEE